MVNQTSGFPLRRNIFINIAFETYLKIKLHRKTKSRAVLIWIVLPAQHFSLCLHTIAGSNSTMKRLREASPFCTFPSGFQVTTALVTNRSNNLSTSLCPVSKHQPPDNIVSNLSEVLVDLPKVVASLQAQAAVTPSCFPSPHNKTPRYQYEWKRLYLPFLACECWKRLLHFQAELCGFFLTFSVYVCIRYEMHIGRGS